MKPSRKLEAQWAAKLRASGFQDLEGADRDAPLSNRGNLHGVDETDDSGERLAVRLAAGAAYTRWAESVLHDHRFASEMERAVWERHAAGEPLAAIGRALRIGYHGARDAVIAVRAATSDRPGRGTGGTQCKQRNVRKLVSRSDPRLLLRLAAVLLQGHLDPAP